METAKLPNNPQQPSNFSSIEWLSSLAVAKHKEGKLEEAIAFYLEIIALDPHQPCSLYVNLVSLMTKVDLSEAIEVGKKGLQIYPDSAELYQTLGMALSKNQEFDRAIEQYERAIEIEPLQPEWVFINLAKILLHSDRLEEALKVSKVGLEYYAKSEYLAKIQLEILIKSGDWQQIKTIFARQNLEASGGERLRAENAFILNEYTVYIECNLKQNWNLEETGAFTLDRNGENSSRVHCFVNNNCIAFVAVFTRAIASNNFEIMLVSPYSQASIEVRINRMAYGLELVDYLNSQPNPYKYLIKENIIQGIVKNTLEHQIASSQQLVQKLHTYLKVTPQLCNDINEPFSINFDLIIPIASEGLFVSGWICDPFDMLEEISAVSALGFTIPFKDVIYYVERPEINKAIDNTAYKGVKKQLGIVAYVSFPGEIKNKFKPYTNYSFRFQIKLKGNINKQVIFPTAYYNHNSAMACILKTFARHKANISLLKECIAPATLAIGKTQAATEISITTFGKSILENPLASIIIPIDKNFDLMRVQFAMMANDDSVKNCELIYILSSTDKKHEWGRVLESYSHLYNLPVRLITTEIGNNYGALINISANKAKSDLCLAMLPDVLPKTENWANKMAKFYRSLPNPGILTPKLIYEDLSIQHAGTTCDRLLDGNYKHFYQGLPSTYPSAQHNRSISATNGACMMFSRQLYRLVDGLSAEYLTPESEAFDFCMKSLELGYQNWYFAEVEMYYFEKQNCFTKFINQYNLESQSKKWHQLINNQR